jgi:hypothetical protein
VLFEDTIAYHEIDDDVKGFQQDCSDADVLAVEVSQSVDNDVNLEHLETHVKYS